MPDPDRQPAQTASSEGFLVDWKIRFRSSTVFSELNTAINDYADQEREFGCTISGLRRRPEQFLVKLQLARRTVGVQLERADGTLVCEWLNPMQPDGRWHMFKAATSPLQYPWTCQVKIVKA